MVVDPVRDQYCYRSPYDSVIRGGQFLAGPCGGSHSYSIARSMHIMPSEVDKVHFFDESHRVMQQWQVSYLVAADLALRTPTHGPPYLRTLNPNLLKGTHTGVLTNGAARSVACTLWYRRALMLTLKAELWRRILMGQTVVAQSIPKRYECLADDILNLLSLLAEIVKSLMLTILEGIIFVTREFSHYPSVQALLEILLILILLRVVVKLAPNVKKIFKNEYVFKQPRSERPNELLTVKDSPDGLVAEAIVNGEFHTLFKKNRSSDTMKIVEMAMAGSEFSPSERKPVGCILIQLQDNELAVFACFFRMGDYLVTAKHVANALASSTFDAFLTGTSDSDRKAVKLDKSARKCPDDFFDLDQNVYKREHDVFMRKMPAHMWAALKLTSVPTKTPSKYNQMVTVCGFKDENLIVSVGEVLKSSTIVELHHTASTLKGHSGSPVFVGKSVVGMHVAGTKTNNIAIRIEHLKQCLAEMEESNLPNDEEYELDWKRNGRSHHFERYDDDSYGAVDDRSGAVILGFSRGEVLTLHPSFRDEYEDMMDAQWSNAGIGRRNYYYDDENRNMPKRRVRECHDENADLDIKPELLVHSTLAYSIIAKEKPVHCSGTPKEQEVVSKYLNDREDELNKLGFDKDKFVFPEITAQKEAVSLKKHLELFHARNQLITHPPTAKELERVIHLTCEKMKANAFEPRVGYKSKENLERIIHSSAIKDSKSPGQPYQAEGMPKNEDVIRKYTASGFADLVLQKWNQIGVVKNFIKGEPTKRKKIDEGMPRCIAGDALHKTVQNVAVFEDFREAMTKNWMDSPVKYCFSPLVPGHIDHLAKQFKKDVWASDKKNWDFSVYSYVYETIRGTIKGLARQPADMDDDEFAEYLQDVDTSFHQKECAAYRCTNGEIIKSTCDGIMKSGFFLTIDANSIGQLNIDYLIKIRMGETDAQILADTVVAGGDDMLQTFRPKFDVERYKSEAHRLGFEIDFEHYDSFEGCEFFSHRFKRLDGVWTYTPERFTKHVMNLRTCKLEELASSLSSAMTNWVWDKKRFAFFNNMFRNLRKEYPEHFDLKFCRSNMQLRYKVLGCEAAME